jgi:glutamate mutase epsilon subunit
MNATLVERLLNDRAPDIFEAARMAAALIAELEAANAVCRRDIDALMSSCDKLEAERDKLKAENDALVNNWASALAGDLVKAGESEFSSDPSGE